MSERFFDGISDEARAEYRAAHAKYRKENPEKVQRWQYSSYKAFVVKFEQEHPEEAKAICERRGVKL